MSRIKCIKCNIPNLLNGVERGKGVSVTQPPTLVCKMEAQSEHVHVARMFFLHVPHQFACSVRRLQTKISASDLSGKSIKSALLVGQWCLKVVKKKRPN